MADDTTRGVHLNEKQLVFVLMAGLVICGVMFLFGVLVGRGVQATRGSAADGSMVSAPQPVPDPAPPADAPAASPGGSQLDDLSYTKRLQQPESQVAPLKTPAGLPAAGEAVSRDVVQPPPDAPDESVAAGGAGPAETRPYTIQLAAFPKRADADAEVKRLKARGYDARVVAPEAGDKIRAFRVRVGSYKTRREADVVARKLATGGQYTPWVIH